MTSGASRYIYVAVVIPVLIFAASCSTKPREPEEVYTRRKQADSLMLQGYDRTDTLHFDLAWFAFDAALDIYASLDNREFNAEFFGDLRCYRTCAHNLSFSDRHSRRIFPFLLLKASERKIPRFRIVTAPHLRLALNREILNVTRATPAASLNRVSQIYGTVTREFHGFFLSLAHDDHLMII